MISENLKRLRDERGYSRDKLARESGVTVSAIRLIEKNKTNYPNLRTLKRLSEALNVSVQELIS